MIPKVFQVPTESPTVYLGHLLGDYQTYNYFDQKAPRNIETVNLPFVIQSAVDILPKLQELLGLLDINISQLDEVSQKLYRNRDMATKKAEEEREKHYPKDQAKILVVAFRESNKSETGLREGE